MKKSKKSFSLFFLIFVLLILGISFFYFKPLIQKNSQTLKTEVAGGGNPTGYITIHDPYYRVAETYSDYGFGVNNETFYGGYQEYLRMFVPPGTIYLYFYYEEAGQRPAISHHDTPPVSQFDGTLNGRIEPYTLSELEAADCLSLAHGSNATQVADDAFLEPLPISQAGWIYVHVGPGGGSNSYYTHCAVVVDTKVYNEWWDKYMANPDGSNNWERDVESVEDYDGPTFSKADFDQDQDVDTQDFQFFHNNYQKTGSNQADLNGDQIVNTTDFSLFHKEYTGSG